MGRFAQADTIVPGGVQGLDRYAYVNNSPINYVDPTGHYTEEQIIDYLKELYGNKWRAYFDAWISDDVFWETLLAAENWDVLEAPTTNLGNGMFVDNGNGGFSFVGQNDLYQYQGYGPYNLIRKNGEDSKVMLTIVLHPVCDNRNCPLDQMKKNEVTQPLYDYSSGVPKYTGFNRVVSYKPTGIEFNPLSGDSTPWLIGGPVGAWVLKGIPGVGIAITIVSGITAINNSVEYHSALSVSYQDKRTYINSR